tara:strand:- start:300 stop:581 length:282 start_codon:yes stop_codon:yes gene_type:complete
MGRVQHMGNPISKYVWNAICIFTFYKEIGNFFCQMALHADETHQRLEEKVMSVDVLLKYLTKFRIVMLLKWTSQQPKCPKTNFYIGLNVLNYS